MVPPDNGLLINIQFNDKCYDSNNGLYCIQQKDRKDPSSILTLVSK